MCVLCAYEYVCMRVCACVCICACVSAVCTWNMDNMDISKKAVEKERKTLGDNHLNLFDHKVTHIVFHSMFTEF